MNNPYLKSSYVQVFPYGTTRSSDAYARILNEQTITRLVRSIVDKDSYVIDFDKKTYNIEFVLHGYYFNCNIESIQKESSLPLYAGILLNYMEGANGPVVVLQGVDEGSGSTDSKFTGVTFSNTPFSEPYKSIQLLDAGHQVPPDSLLKFNAASVEGALGYDVIYCGTAQTLVDEDTDGITLINCGNSRELV